MLRIRLGMRGGRAKRDGLAAPIEAAVLLDAAGSTLSSGMLGAKSAQIDR
jgi:hypothetical protein